MSRRTALAASTALLLSPLALGAQSFQYTSVTKMEMAGALGRMMSMMPGMGGDTETTTSMKGSKIRHDTQESSTIMDWGAETMTVLDHKTKTYMTMSFQDMMDRMSESMGEVSKQQKASAKTEDEAPEPQYDVHISTDRTGKTEKIAGYSAEQVIVTMEMVPKEGTTEPQGQEGMQGTMAVVTELWMSKDFPEYQMMKDMGEQASKAMRESAAQAASASMTMLAGFDPRLPEAASKNAEELKKLDGESVRTVMNFVIVQPGTDLDATKIVAGDNESLSGGEGGGTATSAADAAKKALGGLFGRGKKEEPKPAEPEESPTQVVLMRTTSEVRDVSTAALDDSVFAIPAGYTERKMEGMGGR